MDGSSAARQRTIDAGRRSTARAIIDLDGTLIYGREPISGAARLLRRFAGRFMIVSNNSTHSEAGLSVELEALGLEVEADCLLLAGTMAVELVARDYRGARVLVVGSASLMQAAAEAGLELVEKSADLVLLGRDDGFDYGKLTRIANEIERGAMLIATNPDAAHPGADGQIIPETGALRQAITACATPRGLHIVGKPEPALFEAAARRLGATPADCIVIGDNPVTDGAGAERCGMLCLLLGRDFADLKALTRELVPDA